MAADAAGNFVVVWESEGEDGSSVGVFGQRYTASGVPQGAEFRVNSYATGSQRLGSIAAAPGGAFVVVWTSQLQDGSSNGIFGQRYAGSGMPLGGEFRVNSYTTNAQIQPAVAADPSANFVVVWTSDQEDGSSWGIFGQRFAASGVPLGSEFRVNITTGPQQHPTVASDPAGGFVVAWEVYPVVIEGQRYASSGVPDGAEFTVNSGPMSYPIDPSVAVDGSGNFVVTWTDFLGLDGSGAGVFGRRYAATGPPLALEFRINSYTTNGQSGPSVAADALGRFVVAWASVGQDGSQNGVFAQRYAPILPVELLHFRVE